MSKSEIKFGTDGWRGRIADNFTFDNVRRCTQGFANYLLAQGKAGQAVVVGYDRRFASEDFAAASVEVLASNGFHVWLTDRATPTPVISYAVVDKHAAGAINITASHNPATDNGFKVRDHRGAAIGPDGLWDIEAAIPQIDGVRRLPSGPTQQRVVEWDDNNDSCVFEDLSLETLCRQGLVTRFDASTAYLAHLHDLVDVESIKAVGLKILVDPMWGNGAGWFPRILRGGRTQVMEIHSERNPIFPEMSRPEPITPNIDVGLRRTVELGCDVCLITDGDADRVGLADEHGQFINQLQVYGLLALYLLEVRGYRGPIVKTLSTTSMLEKLGELYHVPVFETGVGFKYVAPKMLETDALIGGEESGGYAFRGHIPERDGIVAGLFLLDLMVQTGQSPAQLLDYLFSKVGPHYYNRIDTHFPADKYAAIRQNMEAQLQVESPRSIAGLAIVKTRTDDGFKYILSDGSWMLIRFSGTEPLMRVYAEAASNEQVQRLLAAGEKLVEG